MTRIHESLDRAFRSHRLVFWYDEYGEWRTDFDSFADAAVEKLEVSGNEFGTKVRIKRCADQRQKFLIYSPALRPPDEENWLLDLLLQSHEFKADRASLVVQEVGLPNEYRNLAEDHAAFFKSSKRVAGLRESLGENDSQDAVRLQMMATLAGTPPDIDSIVLKLIEKYSPTDMFDPASDGFDSANLVDHFWKAINTTFGYAVSEPSMRDFLVTLFRSANPFDPQVKLPGHARVFLQRWKQSITHQDVYREIAAQMEKELQIRSHLESLPDPTDLGESDAFEVFERYVIHSLCRRFENGGSVSEILPVCQRRKTSFWYEQHKHGYLALERAAELRELMADAELQVESIDVGVDRYTKTWWRIDRAYRYFCYHCRQYGQVNILEHTMAWVEKSYVTNFLLPLAEAWGARVANLDQWKIASIPSQRAFFTNSVKPFLQRNQKVFVIISDALRYEAAADFAERLQSENRFSTELDYMLAALPSYTQLGMASLLPGSAWNINASDLTAQVDGKTATGTEGRKEILRSATSGKATAIQAEQFLELNTKTDGRALMRDHDIVYVFHNTIDKVGDSSMTEAKVTDAVEQAFSELLQIVKKVANINCNNMLLTADHGFIFQQDPVHESDSISLPDAIALSARNRRFVIGNGIQPRPGIKTFTASELGLSGDWSAAFPTALGRFPLKGSGKRYVHGGVSPQEVIVPIVRIHKTRTDDTGRVEVDLLGVPAKITTGQISVAVFQEQPVTAKRHARRLTLGVFASPKEGPDAELSELKNIPCDSQEQEPRLRENTVNLQLTPKIDQFNGQTVEIRLLETLPGTNQSVIYKRFPLRVQKSFASDFDDI